MQSVKVPPVSIQIRKGGVLVLLITHDSIKNGDSPLFTLTSIAGR